MGRPLNMIEDACSGLRRAQDEVLAPLPQSEVVAAVSEWAARWTAPDSAWRRDAGALAEPFSFAMTRVSLDALLESLTKRSLWALIDAEDVRDRRGPPLIGHVVAGNTPLLAWVSLLRALLMRSASFVKLPSGGAGEWARLFVRSLAETAPALAACIHLAEWPGGTTECDASLCRNVDLLLVYGGQDTLRSLQPLCPHSVGFLGYGHRISFGIMLADASPEEAARGFARDVLLYDQGGCLSPHTIFVEGDSTSALHFAAHLAGALQEVVVDYPQSVRSPHAAARVQEARAMARMERGTMLWEDKHLRWTVIARQEQAFAASHTHGVVSVQPLPRVADLRPAVAAVAGHLQGCAFANGHHAERGQAWREATASVGVSWLCGPGQLQAPPFDWREDGRDVLRSLMMPPATDSAEERTART